MTGIKLCGLSRIKDIEAVNVLRPEYIGFVFAPASRRYVNAETAALLRQALVPGIQAVGVFVDEKPETVASLLNVGIIDLAQLHGSEDEEYIKPDFLGKEVTGDKRFYNSHLMRYPYVLWGKHFEQEEMNK